MSAPQLVDAVEVVRRDDEVLKLAQVAPLLGQRVHAVIVHCGLTPHTPGGGGGIASALTTHTTLWGHEGAERGCDGGLMWGGFLLLTARLLIAAAAASRRNNDASHTHAPLSARGLT